MLGTIAVTDFKWYEFLQGQGLPEVNFWTPSHRRAFNAPQFSPFLFKLKAPHNAICGFGYFERWSSLPDWLAWDCFGLGNGCRDLRELQNRIAAIRHRLRFDEKTSGSNIGCILISEPTFFPREKWVPQPADWHPRTVTSKGYDLTRGEGRRVREECLLRAAELRVLPQDVSLATKEDAPRYGSPQLVASRLGQGILRVTVTDAYDRSCAVTGERSLPGLEAAHIRPYADLGPHDIRNGLLLRADLHRLLDQGYLTITPEYRLEVGRRLREEYQNGRIYYELNGSPLRLPRRENERPGEEFIQWHREHIYRG